MYISLYCFITTLIDYIGIHGTYQLFIRFAINIIIYLTKSESNGRLRIWIYIKKSKRVDRHDHD